MPDRESPTPRLFTIGHSNHPWPDFVNLLQRHGVTQVIDVRSQPYSRFNPQFRRQAMEAALKQEGVGYLFLGEELGARRAERECYVNGQARYDRIARLPAFKTGLALVRGAARAGTPALLCAEKDPLTCHRTILVTRHLRDLDIAHIREDGRLETNAELEARLLADTAVDAPALFTSPADAVAHAYDARAQKIAFTER